MAGQGGAGVMSIRAGKLRNRVTIQSLVNTQDPASGEMVESWVLLATVWAEVRDLRGTEYWQAAQAQSEVTTLVRIRTRTDILPDMRVLHGSRTLLVDHIVNPDAVPTDLHLLCTEVQS